MEIVIQPRTDTDFIYPDHCRLNLRGPRAGYSKDGGKQNVHLGQLKLFSNELVFILEHVYSGAEEFLPLSREKLIVYVGAGPGDHLVHLIDMFPELTWHLYDDHFNPRLKTKSNVVLFERYFGEEDVERYRRMAGAAAAADLDDDKSEEVDLYFISDIRDTSYNSGSKWTVEEEPKVMANMLLQANWAKMIEPKYSMLKFRPPYYNDEYVKTYGDQYYHYLDGIIYKQPWSRPGTSEARLVSSKEEIRRGLTFKYDILEYEELMSYHNLYTRKAHYLFNGRDLVQKQLMMISSTVSRRPISMVPSYDLAFTVSALYDYCMMTQTNPETFIARVLESIAPTIVFRDAAAA